MKSLFLMIVLTLSVLWALQASKTIDSVSYTERAGGVVPVQKTRLEWHSERLMPFLQEVPKKTVRSLKLSLDRLRQKNSPTAETDPFTLIRLKNGTEIRGRIVQERGGTVWVEIEGGKIAFKREEIASPAPD